VSILGRVWAAARCSEAFLTLLHGLLALQVKLTSAENKAVIGLAHRLIACMLTATAASSSVLCASLKLGSLLSLLVAQYPSQARAEQTQLLTLADRLTSFMAKTVRASIVKLSA